MKIGINATGQTPRGSVAAYVDHARQAEADGFASYWAPELPTGGMDTLTVLGILGAHVRTMEIGTAVIPTFPRHPVTLANQALTVQAATEAPFTLGIGLSHEAMMTPLGLWDDKPMRHLREYLSILCPLLEKGEVDFEGETLSCRARLLAHPGAPQSLVVAALGPRALALAGRFAAGTTLAWVGPKTIESHIVPRIAEAASEAGRGAPRIIATLPVCVTDDPDTARAGLREIATMYASLPSYQAMLEREGVDEPAALGIIGLESEVEDRIGEMAEAGVTDFAACEIGSAAEDRVRTREFLRKRAARDD